MTLIRKIIGFAAGLEMTENEEGFKGILIYIAFLQSSEKSRKYAICCSYKAADNIRVNYILFNILFFGVLT